MIHAKDSDLLPKLEKYFSNRKDVAFAFLYGSIARGNPHKNSDIDIAVYFYPEVRHPIQYEEDVYFHGEDEIWADLERLLRKEVELLVLNRAASIIGSSAARGIRLAVKDWKLYLDFLEAVSMEAEDFMEIRKKDFLSRNCA